MLLVLLVLLDIVVRGNAEALVHGGIVWICRGRLGPQAAKSGREVSVEDAQRVARLGVLVEPVGQQHVRAELEPSEA